MPGFNEIWSMSPTVRLGRLSQSVEVLHGNRVRFAYGSLPRVAPARADTPYTSNVQVAEIALNQIVNPHLLHPSYGGDRSSVHDEWYVTERVLDRGFIQRVSGDIIRSVGTWPTPDYSLAGIEREQSALVEIFSGRNAFIPDDLSLVMSLISEELYGDATFAPANKAPRRAKPVWGGKRAIRLD